MHELIERFEAHLTAEDFYSVTANMRGSSPEEVASRLLQQPELKGLAGPTISPVYSLEDGHTQAKPGYFACVICVEKKKLYNSVKEIRQVRCSCGSSCRSNDSLV